MNYLNDLEKLLKNLELEYITTKSNEEDTEIIPDDTREFNEAEEMIAELANDIEWYRWTLCTTHQQDIIEACTKLIDHLDMELAEEVYADNAIDITSDEVTKDDLIQIIYNLIKDKDGK